MKRKILIGLGVALSLVLLLGIYKAIQISRAIAAGKNAGPPPQAVTSYTVKLEKWPHTLKAIGSLRAVQGALLSIEETGRVASVSFDSGQEVKEGQVLLELDTEVEKAQYDGALAQLKLAEITFKRNKTLREKNAISQSELDIAETNLANLKAETKRLLALINRKKIIAPFNGRAGIRQVQIGQMITAGSPVVELQNQSPLYVDFSLPQNEILEIKAGDKVNVTIPNLTNKLFSGTLTAISSKIDVTSRNVNLQATLENPEKILVPGMFVDIELVLSAIDSVLSVPITSINYAPYGNSIYIISAGATDELRSVTKQVVQLGRERGDRVEILSGLTAGAEIVSSGGFKIIPGGKITINNIVQPQNELDPNPLNS
jgi:membrane fusion protein (multidrug efflux system)